MSKIRFILNEIKSKQDTAAARIAKNLLNSSQFAAANTGAIMVKQAVYDMVLSPVMSSGYLDEALSIDGSVTPYASGDSREPVRNHTILETNDKTVKVELWDVKIDISQENTIVRTAVNKRRGTIKEFIQARDYSIQLTGSLISDSQYGFPIAELQQLIDLFNFTENINISNVLVNAFGVYKVVMESYSIPQSSAKYLNTIPFSIKLISDEDVDLSLEQEEPNVLA